MTWGKSIAEWTEDKTAFVSVPFTWLLPKAFMRCVSLRQEGYHVRAGGPAVSLMPSMLAGVAEIGGDVPALARHNPDATFTTRGCTRACKFCAVPRIEGDFRELATWEPKPVVCDNNLLAASHRHFDRVIDSLRGVPGVDFNQGLDCRLLTPYHAGRLAELDLLAARISWDHVGEEGAVRTALDCLRAAGIPLRKLRVYVLVGWRDTPADALYRCEKLKAWGIRPNVMRYQPLDCLRKNSYVAPAWTDHELKKFCHFWNRQAWYGGIRYEDFEYGGKS